MPITSTSRIVIPEQIQSQEIRGETVLLDLSTENYFGLDSVGTRVWQLLKEGKTPVEILPIMVAEYDIDQDQFEADLSALLERLRAAGLVMIESF